MKYLNRKYQQGGAAQNQQKIMQQIAQALQQGKKPEELVQALVGNGMPEDQATQLIQSVVQQMQGGAQSAKNGAKLEFIQRLQKGGAYVRPAVQDATRVEPKKYFSPVNRMTTTKTVIKPSTPVVGSQQNPKQLGNVTKTAEYPTLESGNITKANNKETANSPVEANNAHLNPEQVTWLQNHLNSLGYKVAVDGKMGKETMGAIGKIQEQAGLQATGRWDENTRDIFKKLDRAGTAAKQQALKETRSINDNAPFVEPRQGFIQPTVGGENWEGAQFSKQGGNMDWKKVKKNVQPSNDTSAKILKTKKELMQKGGPVKKFDVTQPMPKKMGGETDNNPNTDYATPGPTNKLKFTAKPKPTLTKKEVVPVKKEKGGYLAKEMKKGSAMKPMKAKKCLKGCGCGTKMHKEGGVLSTVCSCCGSVCN